MGDADYAEARPGEDYEDVEGTLVFEPGHFVEEIMIRVLPLDNLA